MNKMPVIMYRMLCSSCVLSLSLMNQAQPSLFDFNQTFILLTKDSYLVSHSQLYRYRLQKMLKHKKKNNLLTVG